MWGALIGAGVGAGANVIGSWLQAGAAKKAAEEQARAAREISDRAGQTATEYGGYIAGAGDTVGAEILDETRRGQEGVREGILGANELLGGVYNQSAALLNPYMQAGQTGLTSLQSIADGPGFDFKYDPNEDPSTQFRLAEGQKALERSAAARGGALGGAAAKSLIRYGSGFASTEYQNSFQRAFAKFNAERQQRLQAAGVLTSTGAGATSDLARTGLVTGTQAAGNVTRGSEFSSTLGQQGVGTSGQFRYNAARDVGGLMMDASRIGAEATAGGANARAAGTVGAANAWSTAINNAGQTAAGYLNLRDFLNTQKPGVPAPVTPPVNYGIVPPGYRIP